MRIANVGFKVNLITIFILFFVAVAQISFCASSIVEFTAIGKIESIYKNRASMNILHIIASDTENLNVATGSWISFDIPKGNVDKSSRREREIGYGTVVEVSLIGNVATEYEVDEGDDGSQKISTHSSSNPNVLLWTAQSCKRVKNPKDYLPESEKNEKKGRKKKKEKEKEKEVAKIWTQEETVRGIINIKNDKVYLKEDYLGKKEKGLEIISEEWNEKLKNYSNQRIVLHGITRRANTASGTLEVHSALKVYPK